MVIHDIISWAFTVFQILLIIYILLSWLPHARSSPIGELLERICEPYLSVFRSFIPPIGMIDISPIVALFILHFVEIGVHTVINFILGWLM